MAKHARRGNRVLQACQHKFVVQHLYNLWYSHSSAKLCASNCSRTERERDREKGLCAEIGSQHFMSEFYFATHFYQNTKIMIVSWSILVDVPLHCCIWLGLFMLCCLSLLLGYCKCQGCTEGDSGFGLLQIMKLNKEWK